MAMYMVNYQFVYKGLEEAIYITISDTTTLTANANQVNYTPITGADEPFRITLIDDNRDKFRPVRAKQATIRFISTSVINAYTFSTGDDNRWLVTAQIGNTGNIPFTGYLVMDDHQRSFTDPPNVVTLIATDGIGTLKDVPLTDFNEINPKGEQKIIQYIAWCLYKTGLHLDINVSYSWFEQSYADLPAWDHVYLDAKTFEKDINLSVDCYKTLETILYSFGCFLTQYNGAWWIGHIAEYDRTLQYVWRFDYTGSFIQRDPNITLSQVIGKSQDIQWINADALVNYVRPDKLVKLTYKFETPKEIIDNIDFQRGTVVSAPDLSVSSSTGTYQVEDWTPATANYYTLTPGAATSTMLIVRLFEFGYEKARYIKITSNGGLYPKNSLKSNAIPIVAQDKFTFSFDQKFASAVAAHYYIPGGIELLGDDNSNWYLRADGKWLQPDPSDPFEFPANIGYNYLEGDDTTKWVTSSVEAEPTPVNGVIYVHFFAQDTEVNIQNVQFDYHPFINGSYQKYNGVYRKVSQSGNYKAALDQQIMISDNVRRLFKGGLTKLVSGKYVSTQNWYRGGQFYAAGTTPVTADYQSFAQLQVYDMWNQYNRPMRIFDGTLKGLRTAVGGGMPDTVHLFTISETDPDTTGKQLLLASADMETETGTWTATLIEVNDTAIAKDYASTQEIKYISDY